jgi:hypothetical protein
MDERNMHKTRLKQRKVAVKTTATDADLRRVCLPSLLSSLSECSPLK